MPRITAFLEDCVLYRHGKKWKKRYCLLSKPDAIKRTVTMFITKQYTKDISSQDMDDKSKRLYLIDDITGFEHGRHVYKESHVMALIGCNVVHCIAFEQADTMFRWAETLSKLITSVNFHVTLKTLSEKCNFLKNVTSGTQGNLHVQLNRLCLVGEPADGNKFICDWRIENMISLDIFDTKVDKIKKLEIKSNGKTHQGKFNVELEISLNQTSIFHDTFRTFLTSCQSTNPEFTTMYPMDADSSILDVDSCSKIYTDQNDICACFEKRLLEISIPRHREHSSPDKRAIEHVHFRMRKSKKILQKVLGECQKRFTSIETVSKHDNDSCLFPDDEEIREQDNVRTQSLYYSDLSRDISEAYMTETSATVKEADIFTRSPIHDDIGSLEHLASSSSAHHDLHDTNSRQESCGTHSNVYMTFYASVSRHPLSLINYRNYYRLLGALLKRQNQPIMRSNSFNCIHIPGLLKVEYCRKYSNTNFRLNLTSKSIERHFTVWKQRINTEGIESLNLLHNYGIHKDDECDNRILFHKLPFRSLKEFHCSMMVYLKSGNVCFNLFAYHHFLSLVKEVKAILKNIDSCSSKEKADITYRNTKDKICRQNKIYHHWLEIMQPYCYLYDPDSPTTEPSILDINTVLLFEIIDEILRSRSFDDPRLNDAIIRHKFCSDNNPTIELNHDKVVFNGNTTRKSKEELHKERTNYLESPPTLCMSASTPNFSSMTKEEQIQRINNMEHSYHNIIPNDRLYTMNNTFPKHSASQNKPHLPGLKEGSFKKFRRKYSPNLFIPFIRRKTSSMQSTVSEPICNNNEMEQNAYYNIGYHGDVLIKKSLSAVTDICPYVNVTAGHRYINMSMNRGTASYNNFSRFVSPDLLFDDSISYPQEILDPSKNYGELNFKNPHILHMHPQTENQNSICHPQSQNSFENHETSNSGSLRYQGPSNTTRIHSESDHICTTSHCFSSSDYININEMESSRQFNNTLISRHFSPFKETDPGSLNYVTVVTNKPCNSLSTIPPIYTGKERHSYQNSSRQPYYQNRAWLTPPLSSDVDYCQIDLNSTYALRDVDRMLYDKIKSRDTNSSNNISPDDGYSFKSFEQIPDICSLSSSTYLRDKKSSKCNKKYLQRIFSHKSDPTK